MFRAVPLSIIRSFSLYTQHSCMSYRFANSSQAVWHIPLLCVQWKTFVDGHRNCPKHVEIYSQNKLEKLVHLVGFIIRIYHDARSPERRISFLRCKSPTVSRSDPVSYWMYAGLFPWGKAAGVCCLMHTSVWHRDQKWEKLYLPWTEATLTPFLIVVEECHSVLRDWLHGALISEAAIRLHGGVFIRRGKSSAVL